MSTTEEDRGQNQSEALNMESSDQRLTLFMCLILGSGTYGIKMDSVSTENLENQIA